MKKHQYHILTLSPWPLFVSNTILALVLVTTAYFHNYINRPEIILGMIILTAIIISLWFRDIVRESTFQGNHTKKVQISIRYGMILFILSEVMFFFGFFWAYFHASLAPTIELGAVWPPLGIPLINGLGIPLANTLILLISGISATWTHHSLITGDRKSSINGLLITIFLGIIFTFFQIYEYNHADFSINDSVYGSAFYLLTGFHGFHVFIGTILIIVSLIRLYKFHFTTTHHLGLELALWYWHFVDVVWICLFIIIYL